MTETPSTPGGERPAWQPGPAPTTAVPTAASPQDPTDPASKPQPRLLTVWQTIVVGVACLVVGLGIGGVFGALVGYIAGDHDHGGRGDGPTLRFHNFDGGQMPGMGRGGQGGQSTPTQAPTPSQ